MDRPVSRRAFLTAMPIVLLGLARRPLVVTPRSQRVEHPDPRPGIDASDVLTAEELAGADKDAIAVFDMVREIPQIVDGIHCYCGCDLRSLLVCYTGEGMARGCHICQGEGRLAYNRWKEGQSLNQIRRAIDARFA